MAASPLAVLLGVPDEECHKQLSWDQNKFGGEPDWVSPIVHPCCVLCERRSYLVVQVYCPLSGSQHHRTLYIFTCPEKSCRQDPRSWSVLRMQKLAERQDDKTSPADLPSNEKWTEDADNWGSDEEDTENVLRAISGLAQDPPTDTDQAPREESSIEGMERLAISERSTEVEGVENRFTCHHMNVFNEPQGGSAVNGYEQRLLMAYAEREGLPAGAASWDSVVKSENMGDGSGETYEKVLPSHGDASFMKFMKRVSRWPEQCVRYCWSGNPLLISSLPDEFAPPTCSSCGADRVFELQLMPALIPLLKPLAASGVSLDFGTVPVFTCSRSCWSADSRTREECVILQQDPDSGVIGHL